MNGWEPACDTITRRSGLPRNAHLHAHIYREVAQFLKTTDFVDFDLHRSDGLCCVFTALFIYQNLHNPLSKLVIGLSRLFSGAPSGNRSRAPRAAVKTHTNMVNAQHHTRKRLSAMSRVSSVSVRAVLQRSRGALGLARRVRVGRPRSARGSRG